MNEALDDYLNWFAAIPSSERCKSISNKFCPKKAGVVVQIAKC
jgi:hypothetical protein